MKYILSVVIPSYNEAARIPRFLRAIRLYYESSVEQYEVIVVDDGSRDGTADIVREMAVDWPQLVLIQHESNRGKGAAVRTGMLAAAGEMVLFADADGATPIGEERKLREAIRAGADLAIGSRRGGTGGPEADRPWYRDAAGRAFSRLAQGYLKLAVTDTQCGFKMFGRDSIPALFGPCREEGYLFDLFVLGVATRMGCRIEEVPIAWEEVPGSKVNLIRDSWRMLMGLGRVRKSLDQAGRSASEPSNEKTVPPVVKEGLDLPPQMETLPEDYARSPLFPRASV